MLNPILVALILVVGQPSAPKAEAPPRFRDVVQAHFAAWDKDSNARLSPEEVDALCVDPSIKGAEAAAVAAIKRVVRSDKFEVPELTIEGLCKAPDPGAASDSVPRDREDSPEPGPMPAAAKKPANFQAAYTGAYRRITGGHRELFADETPDLDKCHQGPLGDCFFVAPVGAMVVRDSSRVKSMVTEAPGGGYVVRFPGHKDMSVPALTDAEVALSSTTGDEGLWLPVLEKAMGECRKEASPTKYTAESATDAIAHGGSSASVIKLLTGHQTDRVILRRRVKGAAAASKDTPPPTELAGSVEELAAKVKAGVSGALKDHMLVTAGTNKEQQPPGVTPNHAYAVLSYDEATDRITLWNPHGNTFKPKGEAGLTRGYPTKAGIFSVPLNEFVQIFAAVSFETDRPAEEPATKATPRPAGSR